MKDLQNELANTNYTITKTIKNGIEHITYTPHRKRFETPILFQHGMWHGAWCWWLWQELLAEWGWESTSISLPGHGESTLQRPLRFATLSYYLEFLKTAVDDMPQKPILMGHSMGGALTQWYLKHYGDLPATVLVASWVSHSALKEGLFRLMKLDFVGMTLGFLTLSATPWVRNPQATAQKLISDKAVISPEELYDKLGGESLIVGWQHNPPFWSPAKEVKTPMLWLAGENDAVISEKAERRSATYYGAEYHVIPEAGHNLMMEHNYQETARQIHDWLIKQDIS
jgi:pimeloyl-ACP methyl ester carboxylesterase